MVLRRTTTAKTRCRIYELDTAFRATFKITSSLSDSKVIVIICEIQARSRNEFLQAKIYKKQGETNWKHTDLLTRSVKIKQDVNYVIR